MESLVPCAAVEAAPRAAASVRSLSKLMYPAHGAASAALRPLRLTTSWLTDNADGLDQRHAKSASILSMKAVGAEGARESLLPIF